MRDLPDHDARHLAALGQARALIARLAREGRHHVAAALLTEGACHLGVNLECTLPRGSVCAEPVALGRAAIEEPGAPILFSLAVNRRGEVIPPCGFCREILADFAPHALIAVGEEDGALLVQPLRALLPHAYKAHRRWHH